MKRVFVVVCLVTLGVLAAASMPSPASARRGDRDCAYFSTQRAAQIFYLRHGGPRYDPDRLDGDNDGVACEDNPCPCYFRKHLPRRVSPRPAAPPARTRG